MENGTSTSNFTYNGYFNEATNEFEGPGICQIESSDNLIFAGEWDGLVISGQGIVCNDSEKYTGQLLNHIFHGQGVRTLHNPPVIGLSSTVPPVKWDGTWVQGHLSGDNNKITFLGKSNWEEKYEGQTLNSKMHGMGRLTFKDGTAYEGKFKEGKKHGAGEIIQPDGERITVNYNRG